MSKFSLFTQIVMIVIAVTIGVMYIKPTVAAIKSTQQTTATYKAESDKVLSVNLALKEKIAKVESVKPADVAALKRYIPDNMDEIAVMKDVASIFKSLDVKLKDVSFKGKAEPVAIAEGAAPLPLSTYSFSVATVVSYAELKQVLRAIEVNNYLLQINPLTVTPVKEDDTLTVEMELVTFSRASVTEDTAVPNE